MASRLKVCQHTTQGIALGVSTYDQAGCKSAIISPLWPELDINGARATVTLRGHYF